MTATSTLLFVASLLTVMAAAEDKQQAGIKFWVFREDCYDRFLALDISDAECIKFTASKGIGYAIILGSVILKVP